MRAARAQPATRIRRAFSCHPLPGTSTDSTSSTHWWGARQEGCEEWRVEGSQSVEQIDRGPFQRFRLTVEYVKDDRLVDWLPRLEPPRIRFDDLAEPAYVAVELL